MMRKRVSFFIIGLMSLMVASCGFESKAPTLTATAVLLPTLEPATTAPDITLTAVPPTSAPSPEPLATITPAPLPPDLAINPDEVILYPAPQLYAGDKVTFQLRPFVPDNVSPENVTVTILVDGKQVGSGVLNERNLSGESFGLIKWAWDTTGLAGERQIQVILDKNDIIQIGDENPDNNQISFPVTVQDHDLLPELEANAAWVTADTACCHIHVVSGTAAYRDLPQLIAASETAVQQAAAQLDEEPQAPIEIYFIDRIIGQGGYAGSELVVSYLDRDYAGIALEQVLVHEIVHIIDRQIAPQRISFLAEGTAVWAGGGHYKPEDLAQRAAALRQLEMYVPLAELANDFYPVQHEIGYLEAAAFVNYLIDRQGWSRYRDFYNAVTLDDAETPAMALDLNLQIYYNKTLADIEAEWAAYLDELGWDSAAVADLQTTLRHYDAMRHYQRLYDPTAHFLYAWLPYPQEVRSAGNPADLSRHPQSETNLTLELMLQASSEALHAGKYNRANVLLDSVNRVLDSGGLFQDPLALSYKKIVQVTAVNGYQPQRINLSGNQAIVWATNSKSTTLIQLNLVLNKREWIVAD